MRRPRVENALDRGWEASLTLVVAPAGYGKTIAVESWIANRGNVAASVVADPSDNDPVRLWTSIATAVERERDGAGAAALERLQQPVGYVRPAIDAFAEALTADRQPLVVVLDDLQSIGDEHCLRSLDHAIEVLPENVHLVMCSRTLPKLRIARLRSQGELAEIRTAELAFTPSEARRLFAAVEGVSLSATAVATLTKRTEGWAAALYLAALWLRERPDAEAAVDAFRGSHRHVRDYLTAEVLADLEPDAHRFLTRTSVLAELSGEQCDVVLEASGSLERLRGLERANLLVTELPDRPGWYRYHSLLRDHLLAELDVVEPGESTVLRRRAMAWSLERGRVDDAAEHALAAGEWDALAGFVEDHQFRLLRTGRTGTLARWTASIPREVLARRPDALVAAVIAGHAVGRPAPDIRRLLGLVHAAGTMRSGGWRAIDSAALQLALAHYTDDHVGDAVQAAEAAVDLAADQQELVVAANAVLALTRLIAGDNDSAAVAARAALEHPDAGERPFGLIGASAALAILDAHAGRPHLARGHADRALATTREAELIGRPSDSRAQLADAVTAALEGRLGHAQRAAQRAVRSTIQGGMWHAWALLELARIELLRGDLAAARRSLAQAEELLAGARDAGRLPALAAELTAALEGTDKVAPVAELPSPAELAVLRLLGQCTVREIADALYLSGNTIKSHIRAIYRKLGVSSREEAVARAVALGLLDEAESPR
ncbi:LuxR C-terminal-related transcriptional regulator [Solirubrobacter ginsenosidimutans]|uniref:LuxR C-terminal-related transcriptional regulator n=1 Tax=Solirubrobacter ginsenosidimutans TaxID=490573 RepID=A0A9X3S0C7_9ACTN|nr:LuxR C-terminal-related transcriptional regulator [Solirubrobacter ginsenosidimutans]MDA0159091.1 LuxR C-terminal-related transcriptional regulator [Solirubrobacter ginsenosidimutans]